MALYKGIDVDNGLRPLIPHMPLVEEYRESLQTLQAVWDNLNLLGQMSGTTKEMTRTRESFAQLTNSLLNNLAKRTLARQIQDISGKAQVAIDILVRNLFERTADIGFLAIDQVVRQYALTTARGEAVHPEILGGRFREYVAKYSVYRDVILLSPQGEVLARLDNGREDSSDGTISRPPFLQEALTTSAPFVESYAPVDLFPGEPPVLIYAYRVEDPASGVLGVLCLCFDFPDEMARIFTDLARAGDWSVITLLDAKQRVIASSDPYLVPVGAGFAIPPGDGHILRFAGRNYLASRRATQGYQGYFGPGWSALVLVPLEQAFAQEEEHLDQQADMPRELFAAVLRDGQVFPPELQDIPRQAEAIQQELERSVWNGNVRQSVASNASMNPAFSKILLWEISRTGLRMKDVFARSIGNLQATVVSSLLDDCRFLASLAIDIMDRNLYERANDCRWWALDPVLVRLLGDPLAKDRQDTLNRRLSGINDLYTVYDNLVLFDAQRRIVAVSRPQVAERLGEFIKAPWAEAVLALNHPQHYTVSAFEPTPLYGQRPSYIYGAALFGDQGRVVGGIGIVFDSAPQFAAMLEDALPEQATGAFGLFVDGEGRIIASTSQDHGVGQTLALPPDLLTAAGEGDGISRLLSLNGQVLAVGARQSTGYREYKGANDTYRNTVTALVCVPLGRCDETSTDGTAEPAQESDGGAFPRQEGHGQTLEVATFHAGGHWLGLPVESVVEAVELTQFTRLPNAPAQVAGTLLYRNQAIPLYNLRVALGLPDASQAADTQVVVVRSSDDQWFGVLVDRLGEIPEIPVSHIAPVADIFVGITPVLAAIVKPTAPGWRGEMLTLLSVETMAAVLRDLPR